MLFWDRSWSSWILRLCVEASVERCGGTLHIVEMWKLKGRRGEREKGTVERVGPLRWGFLQTGDVNDDW